MNKKADENGRAMPAARLDAGAYARAGVPTADDPLAVLEVIDRLEVGPVRLEPRRLTATYKVIQGGVEATTELVYRFEEDVFEPGDTAALNLATMAAAQVAINYGLFCREILFHGPLDKHDRRFIAEMMNNTAREIFVLKFLMPNPFIKGPAAELPPVKRESYVRARITYADPLPESRGKAWRWTTDRTSHAVLSSGGKDSLLTFGLLDEIGRDVHPIFVNESGRHWFTALNAYRHFKQTYPHTARVWTNADRVFTWMLRHLPFVRQDFAEVRADIYPVRLWTVAVFVFGALPLLRKRGVGRLLIGDEFDSTMSMSHEGITHYNGAYDQSRYFDNALSRYYRSKGWGVSEFSVLRPLSELLIEKVLVERYPHLQRHQVSCHATHTEGERVLPCGACEKCRRIVGMLIGLGADPERCGYTERQVERCLVDLQTKELHQERGGMQHLAFLLQKRGVLPPGGMAGARAQERPEIFKLRFDRERSPMHAVPLDLREPILAILLNHTYGAVRRKGGDWVDFDPLRDVDFLKPYVYESPAVREGPGEGGGDGVPTGPQSFLLAELTWPRARERFAEMDLALLPVGSIEQHGPHLPLDTDAWDADYLAQQVAAGCSDPKPLVVPLMPYGVAYHHEEFSGTISLRPETLTHVVHEIGVSLARQGINKLVIINGHGGNAPALKLAAQMINQETHIFTTVDTGETSDADIATLIETPGDVHSGEVETSTALATRPHLVRLDEATRFVPEFSSRYLDFSSKRSLEWYARTAKISPTGVLGDPTKASVEKGKRIWEIAIRNLVDFVEQLKGLTLEEIYQRRY